MLIRKEESGLLMGTAKVVFVADPRAGIGLITVQPKVWMGFLQ